ncbi:hypothetical protein QN239_06410 [Mycolicibacterium sp. Y3]
MTDHRLRTAYVAVHRNVYVPREVALDAKDKAVAAWLWSGRRGVVAGLSAAALLGSRWIDGHLPAELNRPSRDKANGIVLHSDALAPRDVDRMAELTALGWSVVRVSGEMLRDRPHVIVQRVSAALRERGLVVEETR